MLRTVLRRAAPQRPPSRLYSSKADLDFQELTRKLLVSNSKHPPGKEAPAAPLDNADWSPLGDADEGDGPDAPSLGTAHPPVQKEELIFKEVLGQVLSSNTRAPKASATTPPRQRSTPLSDSILALFDKPEAARNSPASASPGRASHRGPSSPSIASLMDGLLHSPDALSLSPEEAAKNERVRKSVEPVLRHIDALQTNVDVVAYFEETVVPRFSPTRCPDHELPLTDPAAPAVNSDTVSLILERCIAVLASDFRDPLGAIHLFEMAKYHSIEFFTEACSAEVYNLIIKIRWEDYRDLYSVVSLASEIAINAIQPTLETTELLSKIYREATDSSKGLSTSPLGMPLWTGQDLRRLDELNRYRTRFQSTWASKPILRI